MEKTSRPDQLATLEKITLEALRYASSCWLGIDQISLKEKTESQSNVGNIIFFKDMIYNGWLSAINQFPANAAARLKDIQVNYSNSPEKNRLFSKRYAKIQQSRIIELNRASAADDTLRSSISLITKKYNGLNGITPSLSSPYLPEWDSDLQFHEQMEVFAKEVSHEFISFHEMTQSKTRLFMFAKALMNLGSNTRKEHNFMLMTQKNLNRIDIIY